MARPKTVAAIDLGSNSFHLIVAQVDGRRLRVIDRLREMVRLAAGLDSNNKLSLEVLDRAGACLERFAQRIRDIPRSQVRVVGTNTLRKAHNSQEFVHRAERILGHRIDVIAGREEARLIYLGVSHSIEDNNEQRLVIDIGGGSTELILGQRFEPQRMESLYMGCVSISQNFFGDGAITAKRFRRAEIACLQELEPIQQHFLDHGWDTAIGTSGTCIAISDAIESRGWSTDGIDTDGLDRLHREMIQAGHVDALNFPSLSNQRLQVFSGGITILRAIFNALDVERIRIANGALREGVIYDLIGRIQDEDVRDRAIAELMDHYRVDKRHANHVALTASALYHQVKQSWHITDDEHKQVLHWASQLHEIGLGIAHSQYHKHGAYLLHHMDLPGFSQGEQRRLAALVRGHRRKFPYREFDNLPDTVRETTLRLCILLRVAVVLHRGRPNTALSNITARATESKLKITPPPDWLDAHPLTVADLVQEAAWLKIADYRLTFKQKIA